MTGELLRLLSTPRKARVGRWTLRVLPARELLGAHAEAEALAGDGAAFGLCCNAAVLARCLHRRGRRPFSDARGVLGALSAEEIEELAKRYDSLCENDVLSSCGGEEEQERLLEALAESPYERLKWRVLRSFSALPTERRAREMTDADYVYCALHTVLDGREELERLCPACREKAERAVCPGCGAPVDTVSARVTNPAFDEAKFEERKRGYAT